MPKFGLKTLVLGSAAYLLFMGYAVGALLGLASDPDTFSNVCGFMGLASLVAITIALVKPTIKVARNAKTDIAQLLGGVGILTLLFTLGCTRIEPGYVGIKVNLSGSDKGVQDLPLVNGWVFYNPMGTSILEYPTFVQTAQWTKDPNEGSPNNEEITFNSKENLVISADISLSYSVAREKVPAFYVKYRSDDLMNFTHGFMRNVSRDAFNEVGGRYAVEDLLGPKKELFLNEVKDRVNKHMAAVGVVLDQFGFIGAPRPPENVIKAINAKIAATQAAIQSENELRQAEAEAKKTIARAEGEAKSQVARAEGSAKSKVALAEGEAKANQLLAQSVTPSLLEWRRLAIQEQAVTRWDGKRPTVEGVGSGMILQVDTK
jgi:regulator of protease activity HflC (stomatin/prohibitin superfamily)